MKVFAALLLCLSTCAFSSGKPEPVYQDAVLKSFRTVTDGQTCHTNATTTGDGVVNTNGRTRCTDTQTAYYVIEISGQALTVTPIAPLSSLVPFVGKNSVLYGLLPGTAVQIRQESSPGKYHIKVGKRETLYKLVSAE